MHLSKIYRPFALAIATVLILVVTQPASASSYSKRSRTVHKISGNLVDLAVDQDDPFDGAYAKVRIVSRTDYKGNEVTRARLKVTGIDAEEGTRFGSHVHEGPCVEGDGAAAGPHFNITVSRDETPEISAETEIWLDLEVNRRGKARSHAKVDFVIPDGEAQSIVIHELPTDPTGGAGPRLACISI